VRHCTSAVYAVIMCPSVCPSQAGTVPSDNPVLGTDITTSFDVIVAGFGDGWNLVENGKIFVKNKAEVVRSVRGADWRVVYFGNLASCFRGWSAAIQSYSSWELKRLAA